VTRTHYVPPAADEPLDEVQMALVRALIPAIANRIRAELLTEAAQAEQEKVASAGESPQLAEIKPK
jgi:hypothetical protein